ncbi:MAG TPA: ectonucleotide pyrophosphatase/phosphodiesterase [Longimicrobium sp.]|nr:ectonucleotide pyrophosphatase/phosphodiesterase [Longimicrobium sp.]
MIRRRPGGASSSNALAHSRTRAPVKIARFAAILATLALAAACASAPRPSTEAAQSRPYVVMVSFDGFRHDYPDQFTLPALARMEREGARARALVPTFPSKTFPNHYAIVTGMYAGRHGVVGNEMWDPARARRYRTGNEELTGDSSWYGGEPIWVTAERQGVTSASFFWPVSNAAVGGVRPTWWKPYDITVPDTARVDTMLAWLRLPAARRPHLVLGYFSDVDEAAHRYGPNAPESRAAAETVDRMLARLRGGIARLPFADSVTVIVVSDHGLTATDSAAFLDEYVSLDDTVAVVTAATYAQLFYNGDAAKTERAWTALQRMPHAHVWRNRDIPARYHLAGNPRAGDLFVLMDPPFTIDRTRRGRPADARPARGNHGFDNTLPDMHGIFFAAGWGVRPGSTLGQVENVNVYPFIAHLLGLRPAAGIDGSLEPMRGILRR